MLLTPHIVRTPRSPRPICVRSTSARSRIWRRRPAAAHRRRRSREPTTAARGDAAGRPPVRQRRRRAANARSAGAARRRRRRRRRAAVVYGRRAAAADRHVLASRGVPPVPDAAHSRAPAAPAEPPRPRDTALSRRARSAPPHAASRAADRRRRVSAPAQVIDHSAHANVPRRRRTVHGADLDHERVAALDDHADADLTTRRCSACGRVQEGSFMRPGGVDAAFTQQVSGGRDRHHDRAGAGDRPARPAPGCSPRSCSTPSAPGSGDVDAERHGDRPRRHAHGPAVPPGHRVVIDAGIDASRRAGGYTFVELLVVSTIIMILASAVHAAGAGDGAAAARSRAAARAARDAHRDRQVQGRRRPGQIRPLELKAGSEGYPPDLQTLVDGVPRPTTRPAAS